MAKKKNIKKSNKKVSDDSKLFAFLAVFLSIIGFIIALIAKKDDKYVMFYAKQSLVLFIAWIIIWIASLVLIITTFGLFSFVIPIIGLLFMILWIIQIIYSLSGELKETPVIGQFAEKINL